MKSLFAAVLTFAVLSGFVFQNASLAKEAAEPRSEHTKTSGINPPVPLNTPEAEFSDEARRRALEGDCLLSLIVDIYGNPQNIQILKCADAVFNQPSLDSVSRYRFKPATRPDGTPVPFPIQVTVSFRLFDGERSKSGVIYKIQNPVGNEISKPDPDGVFPLTEEMRPPVLSKFVDQGFSTSASSLSKTAALSNQPYCNVLLSIDVKGRPFNPKAECNDAALEKPAVDSLLQSHYKPGELNGSKLPIRISVHLKF
jgi:TonB family protein